MLPEKRSLAINKTRLLLRGGNVIRKHMGKLVETVVHAKVFSILTGDEHLVGVFAGETGTVARNGKNAARQTAAEVKPYRFIHPALRSERFPRLSH